MNKKDVLLIFIVLIISLIFIIKPNVGSKYALVYYEDKVILKIKLDNAPTNNEIISLETNNKVTKSGLNHRIRKIREIASNLK